VGRDSQALLTPSRRVSSETESASAPFSAISAVAASTSPARRVPFLKVAGCTGCSSGVRWNGLPSGGSPLTIATLQGGRAVALATMPGSGMPPAPGPGCGARVPDRWQGAGVGGGFEPHLVEVRSGGLVVEIPQGTADPHRDRGAGADRVLGGDLDLLVPNKPDHGQYRLLLPVAHDRSAHSVG